MSRERINLVIGAELKKAAQAKAQAEDLTLSQAIRRLLRQWLMDDPPGQEEDSEQD